MPRTGMKSRFKVAASSRQTRSGQTLLAGQLDGAHEPGLILTPPDKANEEDDGYLSASEIASLKLDADWVILSTCNTAAIGRF